MEERQTGMTDRSWNIITAVLTAFIAVMWLIAQSNVAIPGDVAWLSLAAEKFLNGEKMTDSFHDNNPPLCYLIYIPVALLASIGSLPVAAFIYSAGMVLLFGGLLVLVAHKGQALRGSGLAALIIGYLLPFAFLFQGEFGNKDYLIAAALPPFLMAQFVITGQKGRVTHNGYLWLVCALATPFILLKPHYGLLPVCLLLHRFITGRGVRVLRDPDFICLSIGTLLYALICYIWFQDFFREIFWGVSVQLYADVVMNQVFQRAALMAVLSVCMLVLAFFSDTQDADKKITMMLGLMALASVVPFATQMKGFSLHMIPYVCLFCTASLVLAMQYAHRDIVRIGGLMMVILAACAFSFTTVQATPSDFRDADFSRSLQTHMIGNASFLMQDSTTNIAMPLSVYTQKQHASRFSSLWFVAYLADKPNSPLTTRYLTMMAEDLNRYKPGVVLLYHDPRPRDDLLKFSAMHADFQQAWAAYRHVAVVPYDVHEFYKRAGTLGSSYRAYDLYVRR